MSTDEIEIQDLLHIEAVIARLERLNLAACASGHGFITDPVYWHSRLMGTCVVGKSPQLLRKKQDLLERLSAIPSRVGRQHA
ncbi:hypothetical protein [Paraburkholderia azotifigens]|uniref:Uncharacterized protein n=1 Tax=Paraburkholderia azotifigens TaxID=2057004 RepID=A0ABU9R2U5_9BURK